MSGEEAPRSAPRSGDEPSTRDAGPARLVVPGAAERKLARTLERAYPREGCGLLLGRVGGARAGDRVVEEVRPAPNRWEGRDDRYLVDPATLRRAVGEEGRGGPRVLGFYHSHPDAGPRPSDTDRELAWPWYLYLIVPVRDGEARTGRAWELVEDGEAWAERPVIAADRANATGPEA